MSLKSQALPWQRLASKLTSRLSYMWPSFEVAVWTLREGRKNIIRKKSMLEINLRSRCTFYYGTRQGLYIATAIMWPAQRNFKRTSLGVWWCFLGGLGFFVSLGFFLFNCFGFFPDACLITDLMSRGKFPANSFMICHLCSPQEKEYVVSFNTRFWTELLLKYWVNFPLQCLAAQF